MSHRAGGGPYIAGVVHPGQADLHHCCAAGALHDISHHAGPPCVVACRQHRLACLHMGAHPAMVESPAHISRLPLHVAECSISVGC
jgi:hypothetical protein